MRRTSSPGKMLIVCLLGWLVASTALPARKPIATSFGMLGFHGFMVPAWPAKPEAVEVARVPVGSPAEGALKEGDVIVGVGSGRFGTDPRTALADAIDDAETDAAGGKLALLLESGEQASIQLPVLGSYSPTAPRDCPKSEKIIAQTIDALLREINPPQYPNRRAREKAFEPSATKAELLGLMTTGENQHINLVGKLIHESKMLQIDQAKIDAFFRGERVHFGGVTPGWAWGYDLIALGEYFLLAKDAAVLPAKAPVLRDSDRPPSAKEGAQPVPGKWPEATAPTPVAQRRVKSGDGSGFFPEAAK